MQFEDYPDVWTLRQSSPPLKENQSSISSRAEWVPNSNGSKLGGMLFLPNGNVYFDNPEQVVQALEIGLGAALTGFMRYPSFAAAFASTFELGVGQIFQGLQINPQVGTGPYTSTFLISPTNAVQGAKIEIQINFPANTINPTVIIIDASRNVIVFQDTANNNADPYAELIKLMWDGSEWIEWGP